MTKLSVNINKVATLRNARGGDIPNLLSFAKDVQYFGAQGITIHPRPDERHIRYKDAKQLKSVITTEYNIEGNPIDRFMDLVLEVLPTQVTLVPDAVDAITSDSGWDTVKDRDFLTEVVSELHNKGIRVSVFVDPVEAQIEGAARVEADRVELYTGPYSEFFSANPEGAVAPYVSCARLANQLGLGVNAGHDLNIDNIMFFSGKIPHLDEVSIGHAIISEALYFGIENVINMYLSKLNRSEMID